MHTRENKSSILLCFLTLKILRGGRSSDEHRLRTKTKNFSLVVLQSGGDFMTLDLFLMSVEYVSISRFCIFGHFMQNVIIA